MSVFRIRLSTNLFYYIGVKEKTICMVISRGGERANLKIGQDKIQQVELFKYLGSLIIEDMSCTREILSLIHISQQG